MKTARRVEEDIVSLCHRGLDSKTLRIEAVRLLRDAIPIDAFWFATADPATLLFTSSVVEAIPEDATAAFVANEFQQDDRNKWTDLARAQRPVRSLFSATGEAPWTSQRYRDVLVPLGLGDELRAVLRDGDYCWGFMCLHREKAARAFTENESSFLARLAVHLAEGVRTALLLGGADLSTAEDGPGLVLLDGDLSVVSLTPAAEYWLSQLADWPQRQELPQVIYAVAGRMRALASAETSKGLMPRARVRTPAGQWIVLHASVLVGHPGQIAIILEPARPGEIAPLAFLAYGLTEREAEVAGLVVRGLSTQEIATRLWISTFTVQQHLKRVFEKTGVHSRRNLVAQILAQQYLPRLKADAPLAPDGWFEETSGGPDRAS